MKAGDRLAGRWARGHRYEVLTPALPGQRPSPSEHTLKKGAAGTRWP